MSRPVCHLELGLTPAECGELLSRVHHAERLEELSLEINSLNISLVHCVYVVMCLHVLLCVLVYSVSGNRIIFGCIFCTLMCVCGCVYAGL